MIEGTPLFEVHPLPWKPPPAADFDALLLGSPNSVNHSGQDLEIYRNLQVFAVGEETARAARIAGFAIARTGETTLQSLVNETAEPLRYLRLTGRAHVPLVAPAGATVTTRIVYEVRPLPIPAEFAEKLSQGALVLLHSGEAARHFASECDRLGVPRANVAIAALAPRIAEAAGSGWRTVECAAQPNDCALLVLVRDMCH